jgi:hypothetical protein
MPDTSGHDATRPDNLHTMTVRELEARIAAAGVLISHRQILRHCEGGTFDAKKLPATNNIKEWFIAPASVEKGIADIKTLQEQRARRDASRRVTSDTNGLERGLNKDTATSGHDTPRPDMSQKETQHDGGASQSAVTRHVATDFDILIEHPYVKRLEREVDEYKTELKEQRQRTEQLLIDARKDFVTLAQNSQVAQSQTLADFFLKAREWMLGRGSEIDGHKVSDVTTP